MRSNLSKSGPTFLLISLAANDIALATGASIKGRLLAQTAGTRDGSAVVAPAR
jgi:hypothetical protein